MEYWVQSIGQNPRALGPIIVVIVAVVLVFILWAVSRLVTRQKELERDRQELDKTLLELEKLVSLKRKQQMGEDKSLPESFWPKGTHSEPRGQRSGARPPSTHNVPPGEGPVSDDEDEKFADIRKRNLVKDKMENE